MTTVTSAQDDPAVPRREKRLAFVRYIENICRDDPGARAALRSGVRRGLDDVPRMHRIVVPGLPSRGRGLSEHEQRAHYTVAAMLADQPRNRLTADGGDGTGDDGAGAELASLASGDERAAADGTPPAEGDPVRQDSPHRPARYGTSLGASFAEAVTTSPGREREMRASAAEQRLNLLTRQSVNGLHRHLPAAVRYLLDVGVPVDLAQLLDDLIAWPVHSGRISRRWLQDFYRLRDKAVADDAAAGDEQAPLDPAPTQ
ncbi:type I-E CRISPR-associated protein Cse2/CasB [Actinacidiphila sp. DG2A-62]|uniref:type I-E CRISPR-associated protein Cse2/CasB n=1 Tax=Actinacidiphila sp. DG2A-62 TaxID=3108821 RepID=UPI002DBF95DA|nr:type I-E CRISPR-associated protein Cse2/CasB [Actinacidiphila sp. DG2A-62]MEC3994111.1 type I-E CRISPR-associated protein Cse2/CasB [Actinacidiphila sp. DG2A-62]